MSRTGERARVIGSEPIFEGRVVSLRVEEIELPGGRRSRLELIHHPGAAAVVPVDGEGRVVLVRQYRHATGGHWPLEVPAGKLDPGEEPAAAAARECEEETGLRPGRLTSLGWIWTTPGFTDERIHLFLAEALAPGRQDLQDDEELELERLPLAEALAFALDGGIDDGKSIAALVRAARYLGVSPSASSSSGSSSNSSSGSSVGSSSG
jgi:ADP-ribose pyrophosphatase